MNQAIQKVLLRAQEKGEVTYADDGILIVNDIRNLPREETMLNRDMTIFLLCKEGHMQVTINGSTYHATPSHLLVCSRLHVLTEAMISTDYRCSIIAITNERLQDIAREPGHTINHWICFTNNPLIPLSEIEHQLLDSYRAFIEQRLIKREHINNPNAIQQLLNAAICEVIGICMKQQEKPATSPSAMKVSTSGSITQRFLTLLAENSTNERTVQFYADQLCITPKYFSVVIRNETGKTPSKWIQEQLIEHIRHLLLDTTLSIKEICNLLDFPNPSFFGKFTKQHLGCSPLEFRKRKSNRDQNCSPKNLV